jgi:flagellar hook protein FlgE
MNGAFSIALSALQGNQDAIGATGQNLANLNTTGYKGNFVEFRDLVAQSASALPGTQQGLGVNRPVIQTIFSDGGIQSSSSSYAAAIQGDGFFMVQSPTDGRPMYTRDGNFTIDADGYLKTLSGENVQGWNESNGLLNTSSSNPTAIRISAGVTSPPVATKNLSFTANLNAASSAAPGDTELSVPINVVDSLGTSHTLQVTFTRPSPAVTNSWNYSINIPADDLASGSTAPVQTGSIAFNPDGSMQSRTVNGGTAIPAMVSGSPNAAFGAQTISVAGLKNGANDLSMNWSLVNNDATKSGMLTQYSQSAAYKTATQDGMGAGELTKVAMGEKGQLVATFSNGQTRPVSQVSMAKFVNNDSLIAVGNNNFSASVQSSAPSIGTAGTKGLGTIIPKALEGSNVDVALQFTNLITYQRGYQASSKVITTANSMLDDVMQLIR